MGTGLVTPITIEFDAPSEWHEGRSRDPRDAPAWRLCWIDQASGTGACSNISFGTKRDAEIALAVIDNAGLREEYLASPCGEGPTDYDQFERLMIESLRW